MVSHRKGAAWTADSPEPTALLMMLQSNTEILGGNAASLTKLGEQVGSIELEIAKSRQIALGESNSHAAAAESSQTMLRAIDKEVSVLATFVTSTERSFFGLAGEIEIGRARIVGFIWAIGRGRAASAAV
ncbi:MULTISPECIES: hypothetical protein [Mesorhizobium]|uniref:Methyl-accepting transducer domain-containing protein n=2 Tax=Mesorhizobium TaxID=68287 RepID=A0ABU5ANV4_9HYPH|nr:MULTISPECIES: hypothetical protein [Mesorhizobium]MDX8538987.1 hypothetical protein [Mesorhizobium abyssinicae]RUW24173.1 hypothetical protein EOA34_15890 [Mesorhizobium sp. M4B.F.Ca.ET.013.02.1.1]RWF66385.1 MAG: hypothetical protein EOS47_06685 [Mesorhizobium sp.]TIT44747.1 MAG: hypothetical protein E5W76_01105 [Mesorhizobium sp.]TIW96666.1 MAG: hypothetical protein E5V45_18975 [Mesorhizobium sp.]